MNVSSLPQVVTAIGGLGTAAFGLLEAVKPVMPWINHIGFGRIQKTVTCLTPNEPAAKPPLNALPQSNIIDTLLANWVNGTDVSSQKAIAKSLIKLHLSEGNSASIAAGMNVDPALLTQVAKNIVSGTPLNQQQSDAYARFDLILTAMLDESYQHADQVYRNWTRGLAALIAVGLGFVGGWTLSNLDLAAYLRSPDMGRAILIGVLATPLAPIAKDLSSALTTAVNAMQFVKK
jgi:hypothetical protein